MRHALEVFLGLFITLCLATVVAFADAKADEKIKPAQLVGKWVHTNAATMDALEFTRDGKAFVYFGGGNEATTADYSILDDGRLNLSLGGQASFFIPSLSGEQLNLKEPDSGQVSQYRRLKAGEQIPAAIAQQKQSAQKAVAGRNAAVPALLARQDLVLISVEAGQRAPVDRGVVGEDIRAKVPTPAALQFAPRGPEYAGRIWFEGKPLRVDAVGAQIQNPQAESPTVAIWFGPGTAAQNGGTLFFHPVGSAPDITLAYSFVTGGPPALMIKPDAAMHAQILEHVKAEAVRLEALKGPIVAMLKDYAVLKGTSQSTVASDRAGFTDEFILSRNPQNNTWVGQAQVVNKTSGATEIFPVVATVAIVGEKPALQLYSQKRLYQFTDIDPLGGKLSGAWQMPNNPAGRAAVAAITQAVDAKGREQLFTARKAALQQMGAGAVFHAVLNDQYTNGTQPPNPIAVTLTTAAGGSITGKVEYPLEGCTMDLTGKTIDTPLGPQLQLRYTGGQPNPGAWGDVAAFIKLVEHETWTLSPGGDAAAPMRLSGYSLTNPGVGSVPVALQLLPYAEKEKTAAIEALNGARFKVVNPRMDPVPNDIVEFTVDPATKRVSGRATTAGKQLGTPLGSTFSSEIKDRSGWIELTTPIMRPVDKKPVYAFTIVVTQTDSGLYMNGCTYNIAQGPTRPVGRWDAVQITDRKP